MLPEPIYFRPPDYRYKVRADPPLPLFAGISSTGRQVLVIAGSVLEFTREGRLTGARDFAANDPLPGGFGPGVIAVRRFWLADRELGISDVPQGLLGFPADPDEFTDADRAFVLSSEWYQWGNFALRCGRGQLFIGRDGECLLHST